MTPAALRVFHDPIIWIVSNRASILQVAESLDTLKSTLEAVRDTTAAKRARLADMRCRRFLCASETAGRVGCLSMQYVRRIGYLLYAGYSDGRIRQWDVKSESVIRIFLTGVQNDASCLCFGGERMFSAGEGGVIKVWNLTASTPTQPAGDGPSRARTVYRNEFDLGHTGGVLALRLVGNLLLSAAADSTVRVWNLLACDFQPMATTDAAAGPGEGTNGGGDDDGREDGLMTARSGRSSISVGSSRSMFSYKSSFGGSVTNDLAARVISISIYDEDVDFTLDPPEDTLGPSTDLGVAFVHGTQVTIATANLKEDKENDAIEDASEVESEDEPIDSAVVMSGTSLVQVRRRSSVGCNGKHNEGEVSRENQEGSEDDTEDHFGKDGDGEMLGEWVYMDLLDMAGSLPGLDSSLQEHIDTANKWTRRAAPTKPTVAAATGRRG